MKTQFTNKHYMPGADPQGGAGAVPGQFGIQLGYSAANTAQQGLIGGILGQVFAKSEDRRQLRQQGRLQELQIQGSKELTDYNYAKQLQMWKDTNYKAQVEQLEAAGLNPGLLYGMSGGGGTTTGSGAGASVTGAQSKGGGGEMLALAQTGMGLALQRAQQANIEANTEKTKAEAAKIAGVDTELGQTQIQSLTQGIQNQKAQQKLTEIQTEIGKLDAEFLQGTINDRMKIIETSSQKMITELALLRRENDLAAEQYKDKIDLLRAEVAQKLVQNALTSQKITESKAQIQKWGEEIAQDWRHLIIEGKRLGLSRFEAEMKAKYPGAWNVIGRILNETAEGIGKMFGQQPDTNPPK